MNHVDVFRINFSHGSHLEHKEDIETLRRLSASTGKNIAVMQDIPGPKLRIGKLSSEPITLKRGGKFKFVKDEIFGDQSKASVNYPEMLSYLKQGDMLYLADGLIRMKVRNVDKEEVECVILEGGLLTSGKGISFPRRNLTLKYPTEEDERHLRFGCKNKVDFVALSFVRQPDDIENVRSITGDSVSLIAKIETKDAVQRLKEILEVSDGIMVARGDLGVDVPVESVPELQERIIELCVRNGKPSIVATQMLESMVRNPVPTRAEVADIATAVKDGADALMLSDETAVGRYPLKAVIALSNIASYAEKRIAERFERHDITLNHEEAVSRAACILASYSDAKAIVTPTQTGTTARRIAMFRPKKPIVALCTDEAVIRKLKIVWGVYPVKVGKASSTDKLFKDAIDVCMRMGIGEKGDYVVITSGTLGVKGSTNMVKIIEIQ
jgi:pyruvate kinase